jgi:GNAT superfamily N-acetyltransferase
MSTSKAASDGNDNDIVFQELTAAPRDLDLLRRFYQDLYLPEFPDPDERESLDNMTHYLELKAQGWYGANNYHIVLLTDSGRPVAGSVSDYLSAADAGVIEFLTVAPAWRRRGLGARLLSWTETTLAVDAGSRSARALRAIVAEMHDPRIPDPHHASLAPQARARIWSGWGYRKLDFDYVQPALSASQHAARHLMLLAKIPNGNTRHAALRTHQLRAVLREYFYWAMRIEQPERTAEYQQMCAQLADDGYVDLLPLDDYLQRSGE